jgi:hypothetical protein
MKKIRKNASASRMVGFGGPVYNNAKLLVDILRRHLEARTPDSQSMAVHSY